MPVPQEILDVKRPVNTVVFVYGVNKDKYGVRQRVGCVRVNGKNRPVNGPTVGHIVNGVYVPNKEVIPRLNCSEVELKYWGNVYLCDRLMQDILEELQLIYNPQDAYTLYCIMILRVCEPGIKDYELKDMYDCSFLSELYPGIGLSKNTVCEFWQDLGKAYSKITKFMRNRADNIKLDHHVLIDGTLKSNESEVNTLSNFSRKAKTKGTRDISVLYAFDLEQMEPICSQCFPGNMLDATSYEDFISNNHIQRGIIVADKGFPASGAKSHFDKNPELHYMNPLKRNSKYIEKYKLYEYEGLLNGYENISYKVVFCQEENKWLYSFRDAWKAGKEERDYLSRAKKKGNYSDHEFRNKWMEFGTVILECDYQMSAEIAYKTYESRWQIEIVMRFYKSACEFDETRVHSDYSVHGSEFCDFLSTLLTFRLLNFFDEKGILLDMTYKQTMKVLKRAQKVKDDGNWKLIKMNPGQMEQLSKMELITPLSNTPKRKPGRPKKSI